MASITPSSLSNKVEPFTGKKAYTKLTITNISQTGGTTNQTTVEWKITVEGDPYVTLHGLLVTLGGVTLYDNHTNGSILSKWEAGDVIKRGKTTFNNKTDGSLTLRAYIKQLFYYGLGSNGSRWNNPDTYQENTVDMVCSTIPRYAKLGHGVTSATETQLTVSWNSDQVIDYLWYQVGSGDKVGVKVADAKSGKYTINGLTAGTTYNIVTSVRRKDNQLTTVGTELTANTYDYPYCTETPNFVIGEEITLNFYNPLKRDITFNIIANGTQLTYDWNINGTTYSGIYAENVQTQLYNSIPNSQSGTYAVVVTYGSSVKTRNNGNTYTVDPSKCLPIYSAVYHADSNFLTKLLTHNDQELVKGYSTLTVTIPTADKMVAQKGATPSKYVITVDTISKTVDYSTGDIVVDMGVITSSGAKRLNVWAYDSRGLSTLIYKDITVHDYKEPTVNIEAKRLNNFEAQTTLKVGGTYTVINGSNAVNPVQYRYREIGGEWTVWQEITLSNANGEFTCSDVVLSLDNKKSFEFEVRAIDALDQTGAFATIGVGEAIFFISSNQKACFINGQKIIMYDIVETWGAW